MENSSNEKNEKKEDEKNQNENTSNNHKNSVIFNEVKEELKISSLPEKTQKQILFKKQNTTIIPNQVDFNFIKDGEQTSTTKLIPGTNEKENESEEKNQTESEKEKKNNLIIFDWDDTLFCTSFLNVSGFFEANMNLSQKEKEQILYLEKVVIELLEKCINKCRTYIITNSEPGWVDYSSKELYKIIYETKLLSKIDVISARGRYEKRYPDKNRFWKVKCFDDVIKEYDSTIKTNIICIGDSFDEVKAGKVAAKKFKKSFIKAIKFKENPTLEDLINQINLVNKQFDYIYETEKNWNIKTVNNKKK